MPRKNAAIGLPDARTVSGRSVQPHSRRAASARWPHPIPPGERVGEDCFAPQRWIAVFASDGPRVHDDVHLSTCTQTTRGMHPPGRTGRCAAGQALANEATNEANALTRGDGAALVAEWRP